MTRPIRNAVTLVVDGREVTAPEGTMLVDAAKRGDVEIPVFCYEPKLTEPVGACRMCLVEIEGMPKLQTACSTPIRDGMVVYTQTDGVQEAQNAVVEFLLANHPLDCPVCDKGGECPLQDISMGWGPGKSRFTDPKRHFKKPVPLSPLIALDRERCILCYRCVRFSQEVSEDEQLQLLERGDRSYVGTFNEKPYVAPFHGNIIELCPVGALTTYTYRFRARPWDIEQAGSVCTLCPSQCNVKFSVRDEKVMRTLVRDNEEVDDGWLCDKGRFGFQMLQSDDRITGPMARQGDGSLAPIGWDDALTRIAGKLREAGSATAAIAGGGASNEEGWLLQRIVREGLAGADAIGSPHPLDPALTRELARPELTARTSDLGYSGAILVIGAEPLNEMPILDLRIRRAVRHRGTRLAVASERPSSLDGGSEQAVRIAPGNAAAFLASVATAARGEKPTGANAKAAASVAEMLGDVRDPMIVWGERLRREPGAVEALLDCAKALGMADKIGPGLYEVPAEANARGLRETGCSPLAPGLGGETGREPDAVRAALESGELKAAILCESNPVRTYPDGAGWNRALAKASFVLAISMFDDESTEHADLVLPATSFAEKEGTVTHPDGRLQRLRPNVPVPADTRATWEVLLNIAATVGVDLELDGAPEVFDALAQDVPFYEGLTYEEIGGMGVRWQERPAGRGWDPGAAADGAAPGASSDGAYAAAGNGSRATASPAGGESAPAGDAPGAAPTDRDGLLLSTYRDIWADPVTERNPALEFLIPAQRVELSKKDAKAIGVETGDAVRVSYNGASVQGQVAIRDRAPSGIAYLMEGTAANNANALTNGEVRRVTIEKA